MKAKPLRQIEKGYIECDASEATHVQLSTPGPLPTRIIPVQIKGTRKGTGNWTWNGSVDAPTLRPSVLTDNGAGLKCHSWINDGKIQFLNDCSHDLAGTTQDLLEVD